MNRLMPQADAIFQARLHALTLEIEKDTTLIKQPHGAREILVSSITVMAIYSPRRSERVAVPTRIHDATTAVGTATRSDLH